MPRSGPYRKYRNVKTWLLPDGSTQDQVKGDPPPPGAVLFDSRKEAKHYAGRLAELRAGAITNLQRQVPFRFYLTDTKGRRRLLCKYVADLTYLRAGELVVEDVKSGMTRRLREYKLKKLLLEILYGHVVQEV